VAHVAGIVALTELVIHGWDVSAATGQDFDLEQAALDRVVALSGRNPALR
jgi:hypothetical protein